MKKLLLGLVVSLLFAGSAFGSPTLRWDVQNGEPDGFILSFKELSATIWNSVAIVPGTLREYDLGALNLQQGVRYEFFLQATESGSQSAESDHLRYTMPSEPQVVEIPAEARIVIEIER